MQEITGIATTMEDPNKNEAPELAEPLPSSSPTPSSASLTISSIPATISPSSFSSISAISS